MVRKKIVKRETNPKKVSEIVSRYLKSSNVDTKKRVIKLVKEMDQAPEQVLIEVLIAEISMGESLDLGVELSTLEAPKGGGISDEQDDGVRAGGHRAGRAGHASICPHDGLEPVVAGLRGAGPALYRRDARTHSRDIEQPTLNHSPRAESRQQ